MKRNIFIVDGDEMFSSLLFDCLSRNSMLEVHRYPTGEAAMKDISREPFAIILDYNLDTIDQNAANGLDILRQLKDVQPDIHALMLSSQSQYGVAVHSISEGAEEYIMKDETAFEKIYLILDDLIKKHRHL